MKPRSSNLGYIFITILLCFLALLVAVFVLTKVGLYTSHDTVWGNYIKISLQTIFMFGLPPLLLRIFGVKPLYFGQFTEMTIEQKQILRLALLSWFLSVSPVYMLSKLNSMIHFPEKWSSLETELRTLQETSETFLHELISTEGTIHFFILIVVIAVIPAIFEELFFRGCLQSLIIDYTGKVWSSIVISSLVFSLFHGEFFSILPRLFLGIVLGMAYYSSRTLWIPILLHFMNNFLSLVLTRYFTNFVSQQILWLLFGRVFGLFSAVLFTIAVISVLRRMKEIGSN